MRRFSSIGYCMPVALALTACAFVACGSSDSTGYNPVGSSGSGASGAGSTSGAGTTSGTASGVGSSGVGSSGAGTASGVASGNSTSGSDTTGSVAPASGSASGATSPSGSSGAGVGPSGAGTDDGGLASAEGGAADAGTSKRACPAASVDVLSDFEEGTSIMVKQGTPPRNGSWFTYSDTMGPAPTPAKVGNFLPAAPLAQSMCNQYAFHSTVTGHSSVANNQNAGFGANFLATKGVYDLSAYQGISFSIKAGSAGQGPVSFDVLTTETQVTPTGTAATANVDEYNVRNKMLTSIGTTWQTVYVPFSMLTPLWFPSAGASGCGSSGPCQAPNFNPAHAIGVQFSIHPNIMPDTGAFDLWLDDVTLYTGDQGLLPPSIATMPTFNDGATGWKCALPKWSGGTAKGKYLLWAYNNWKSSFVKDGPGGSKIVVSPELSAVVSEGIAYGMLISAFMNDKTLFDGLWSYWLAHEASGTSLMTWKWSQDGSSSQGNGSATDADEDAAFALLIASKRGWSYASQASKVLADIWAHDIDASSHIPLGGSNYSSNGTGTSLLNPSYFAPAYYTYFAASDSGHDWGAVKTAAYGALKTINGKVSHGLVPAWCGKGGGSVCSAPSANSGSQNSGTDVIYQYDSHRIPWRVGLDACWYGSTDATSYLSSGPGAYFASLAANSNIGRVLDQYNTDGSAYGMAAPNSMSLIGAAGVGALSGTATADFASEAWQFVLDGENRATLDVSTTGSKSGYSYYNATVGLLALLSMSGNFYPM